MRSAVGAHERGLEVERERGEVMAEGVVELAGDAEAFGEAAAVGDEILHGAKLRARPQLAVEQLEREERQDLKSEIRRREQKGRAAVPVKGDGAGQEQRLDRDPRQSAPAIEQRRQAHGDHHQQRAFESVAKQQHHDRDAERFHRQQRQTRMFEIGDEERAEEDVRNGPAQHHAGRVRALNDDRQADHQPGRQARDAEDARLRHGARMTQQPRRVNRPEVTCRGMPRAAHAPPPRRAYVVRRRISSCEHSYSLR